MRLSSLSPSQLSGAQIALVVLLAIIGFVLLLPRPHGRFVPGGVAALLAAVSAFGVWLYSTFGKPMADAVGTTLFCLFSISALVFGTVLVVQRNPARGAIAFAFVILSTCGLFLLLAAPFLMAATIIIYAGAIIVTFLFVLMLSQVEGLSDENDRSREPLLGALGGFAFMGLVLFAVYLSAGEAASAQSEEGSGAPSRPVQKLPAPVIAGDERARLRTAAEELNTAADRLTALAERLIQINDQLLQASLTDPNQQRSLRDSRESLFDEWLALYDRAVEPVITIGPRIRERLTLLRGDQQATLVRQRINDVLNQANLVRNQIDNDFLNARRVSATRSDEVRRLGEDLLLLAAAGDLPARNVSNIGYLLYADHLLAVELAGTLLLVATIGAVAIAKRRGIAA